MAKTHEFEVEGIRFELSHLSVDDACHGLEVLSKTLGPAIQKLADVAEDEARGRELVLALSAQASHAATLVKLFAPVCKVSRSNDGTYIDGERLVALKPFINDCFAGRVDLLMAFLFEAVQFEYAAFLGALAAGKAPAAAKA